MRKWDRDSSASREVPLTPESSGLGLPEVHDGVRERVDVPLRVATDEQVIAALGRAFNAAWAKAEGR